MIRLALLLLAFVAGCQVERDRQSDLCLDAGGRVDERGLCMGARPQ